MLQGVMPDIVVFGTGAGNGYPVAGLVTSKAIARRFSEGPAYFNTFGGGNAACASGLAVLDVIASEGLQKNSREVGSHLLYQLAQLQEDFPEVIGEVRGRGLFIGVEFVQISDSRAASPGKAQWIKEHMKAQQVQVPIQDALGMCSKTAQDKNTTVCFRSSCQPADYSGMSSRFNLPLYSKYKMQMNWYRN